MHSACLCDRPRILGAVREGHGLEAQVAVSSRRAAEGNAADARSWRPLGLFAKSFRGHTTQRQAELLTALDVSASLPT
eukprot:1948837-Pleurochrysis_carterae.AAC.3